MNDQNMKGMKDASRVDLNDEYEIQHWTNRFKITEEELRRIVEKVGVMVDDVEKEIINR